MGLADGAVLGTTQALQAILWQQSAIIVGNANAYSGLIFPLVIPSFEDSSGEYQLGLTRWARFGDLAFWEVTSVLLQIYSAILVTSGSLTEIEINYPTNPPFQETWTPSAGLEWVSNGVNVVFCNPMQIYLMTTGTTTTDISQGRWDHVIAAISVPVQTSPARSTDEIVALLMSEIDMPPALYAPFPISEGLAGAPNRLFQDVGRSMQIG